MAGEGDSVECFEACGWRSRRVFRSKQCVMRGPEVFNPCNMRICGTRIGTVLNHESNDLAAVVLMSNTPTSAIFWKPYETNAAILSTAPPDLLERVGLILFT